MQNFKHTASDRTMHRTLFVRALNKNTFRTTDRARLMRNFILQHLLVLCLERFSGVPQTEIRSAQRTEPG